MAPDIDGNVLLFADAITRCYYDELSLSSLSFNKLFVIQRLISSTHFSIRVMASSFEDADDGLKAK